MPRQTIEEIEGFAPSMVDPVETAVDVMEEIETIMEKWQEGKLGSEVALQQITELIDSL